MKKMIKYDVIHPAEWLAEKKAELTDLPGMSLEEYRDWLNRLRSNYSDFYTYWLTEGGEWEAEEYYLLDKDFAYKVSVWLWGEWRTRFIYYQQKIIGKILRQNRRWENLVLKSYARRIDPQVLFARSQPRPSEFWRHVNPGSLLVARLSARLPKNWHPNDFDLIYTDLSLFQTFFEVHGTPSILNKQGFDARVLQETTENPTTRNVLFVGGLGTQNFTRRTEFVEQLAGKTPIEWYGYWWSYGSDGRTLKSFPNLTKAYRGKTSGLEMFQLYRDAAICLNDYVDTANGVGYNQRMFEVMGVGGFLLTREAPNFADNFPEDIFVTYRDLEDCLKKIDYYLHHPEERREISKRAADFIRENYSYKEIARNMGHDLSLLLEQRSG